MQCGQSLLAEIIAVDDVFGERSLVVLGWPEGQQGVGQCGGTMGYPLSCPTHGQDKTWTTTTTVDNFSLLLQYYRHSSWMMVMICH